MYTVHFRLIGKCVVDYLLVIIKYLSLGVMAKAVRANIDRKLAFLLEGGQFGPKFQVEGFVPTNHSSC